MVAPSSVSCLGHPCHSSSAWTLMFKVCRETEVAGNGGFFYPSQSFWPSLRNFKPPSLMASPLWTSFPCPSRLSVPVPFLMSCARKDGNLLPVLCHPPDRDGCSGTSLLSFVAFQIIILITLVICLMSAIPMKVAGLIHLLGLKAQHSKVQLHENVTL